MLYLVSRGIVSIVFLVCFIIELPFSIYNLKRQGRPFIHNFLFNLVRIGASIAGIIVASQNIYGEPAADINTSVIVAEIVLTSIGTFWLYATGVSIYYLTCRRIQFEQGPIAQKIHRFQDLAFTAMIALTIASGALTSNFPPSSTVLQLRQAYSVLYIVFVTLLCGLYARLWIMANPREQSLFIWATIGMIVVFIKSIYIVGSAFAIEISPLNFLLSIGWYAGANFIPDFLASVIFTLGGLFSPPKSHYETNTVGGNQSNGGLFGSFRRNKNQRDVYQQDVQYR